MTAVASSAMVPMNLRLTRRGRVVIALLALSAGLAWNSLAQSAVAGTGAEPVPVSPHTVAAGETLWDIARTVTDPGQDVREVVDEIVDLNGLGGAGLRAGEQILVPLP